MKDQDRTKEQLRKELAKLRKDLQAAEAAAAEHRKAADRLRESKKKLSRALEESKHSRTHMTEQERMQALSQMASGVVHDFNNSLTPILSASDYLLTNPKVLENEGQAAILLESIRTSARDARDMILQLREFYHTGKEVALQAVDVSALIEQVLSFTERRWKEDVRTKGFMITVKKEIEDVPPIQGNDARLREVLTNLVFNAVDAMPEGGTLTLRAHLKRKMVVIELSDTGKGMSEEILDRCFEPFFSTKGKKGMGMGLAMVYGIIYGHEGEIKIESEEGKGTTFIIKLPVAKTIDE